MSIQTLSLIQPELTLLPQALVEDALHGMLTRHINHLAVCDETGHFVGMVSSNSLLNELVPSAARVAHGLIDLSFAGDAVTMLSERLHDLRRKPIGTLIDRGIPVFRLDAPILEMALLLSRGCSPIPIVDKNGVLLGLLSRRALLAFVNDRSNQLKVPS